MNKQKVHDFIMALVILSGIAICVVLGLGVWGVLTPDDTNRVMLTLFCFAGALTLLGMLVA